MKKLSKLIRCMAYKSDDLFIAICLDLSLASQANTLEEAIDKLASQIADFVTELNEDPQHAHQLLNRSAPISLWIRYYWFRFLLAKGNRPDVSFFNGNCPA